ncbi:cell wall-associated NlpC family hydrolase [Bacillus pakistanensis]|uniref:Cell wall-associated NlpC family hydrolase n=1 Tax=Rossellomorea pakistanensis TaxID=992288 RepID=A0ABS2NJ44_9BACI|nr:hypothetical protein [Bacillus pakistanensis]MBM7587864.1 cell wall-associated NlpC family hydrolase [Bacillus pakistanensis]
MYFRNILVTGLIVGAALFFPSDVFAKNDGQDQKPVTSNQNVEVKKVTENQKKPKVVNPVPATVKKNSQEKDLPSQASEKAREAVKASKQKANKPIEQTLPNHAKAKKEEIKKKPQPANKKIQTETSNQVEKFSKPVHNVVPKEEPTYRKADRRHPVVNDSSTQEATIKKEDPPIHDRVTDKENSTDKKKTPISTEKFPKETIIVNHSHNIKAPGGTSKDRTGHGQTINSFIEKWFQAEKGLSINLIQSYCSRERVYRNQWVHAPPTEPPKMAPDFFM